MKQVKRRTQRYVVCVNSEGYAGSLERMKLYRVIPDAEAKSLDMLRIVDESGEDYLYPSDLFAPIKVEAVVARALMGPGRSRRRLGGPPSGRRAPDARS